MVYAMVEIGDSHECSTMNSWELWCPKKPVAVHEFLQFYIRHVTQRHEVKVLLTSNSEVRQLVIRAHLLELIQSIDE